MDYKQQLLNKPSFAIQIFERKFLQRNHWLRINQKGSLEKESSYEHIVDSLDVNCINSLNIENREYFKLKLLPLILVNM